MKKFIAATYLWLILLPVGLYVLGSALNQAAIIENGDLMPVRINPVKAVKWFGPVYIPGLGDPEPEGKHIIVLPDGSVLLDDRHSMMTGDSRLKWLSDIFDFNDSIQSVGDLLIGAGEWLGSFAFYIWGALVCLRIRRLME